LILTVVLVMSVARLIKSFSFMTSTYYFCNADV